MFLESYIPAQIIVPLPDHVLYGTVMKKDALFVSLFHEQDAITKECTAHITLLVRRYAVLEDGSYGPLYDSPGCAPNLVTLIADNDTVVEFGDPQSATFGDIIGTQSLMAPGAWEALRNDGNTYLYQGCFFQWLRDNAPLVIGEMIRRHILQAEKMGRKLY